ncbi:uncharacterized protein PAC_18883 [Phialocephala subalpina]|uniref:Ankyrin repeat protein n=1 Tax=Phialocephala subalpina TaxID=576137 RepID=A0A1L7XVA2_9HELO|nr:uncharacterized protein PAC_18883 [Phialocephala subalpina]
MDMFTLCRFLLEAEPWRLPDLVLQLATENTEGLDKDSKISSEFSSVPYLRNALQSFLEKTRDEKPNVEISGRNKYSVDKERKLLRAPRNRDQVVSHSDLSYRRVSKDIKNVTKSNQMSQIIIRECTSAFFDPSRYVPEDFQFFEMFENSIGKVTDGETACYDRFIKALAAPDKHDPADITEESNLLREIKDISDELRILDTIFTDQIQALSDMKRSEIMFSFSPGSELISNLTRQQGRLNDLMDLRQKYANLSEAKSARKQAEDTGKQGNTIMVFTIVTILFLPASFMASFFALPVDKFPRVQTSELELSYVVKWMLTFTVPMAVFFISLAFYINEILAFFSRILGLDRQKDQEGSNPPPIIGTVGMGNVVPGNAVTLLSTTMPPQTQQTTSFQPKAPKFWMRRRQNNRGSLV